MTYYPPICCLLFFFLASLFCHFSYASSNQENGLCETLFRCGHIAANYPFWGGNRPKHCGHAPLELRCNRENRTSLIISNEDYYIFHVDKNSTTLRLARADLLGSFCSATFNATTLLPEIFELFPTYKNLTIFYDCNPHLQYLSSYTCPERGLVSFYQSPNYHRSCQSFTLNVPTTFFPEEKELNLTHLEFVLKNGFEVKVKIDAIPCEECSTSTYEYHKRCSQTFTCANQVGLLYPFWIPGRVECGHPNFKLDCSTRFAELTLSSVKYRLLAANYDTHIIRLARSDYINSLCPSNPLNVSFDQSILPFTPDTTELLTIYYQCNGLSYLIYDSNVNLNVKRFPCKNESEDVENYLVVKNSSSDSFFGSSSSGMDFRRNKCKTDVTIPASTSLLDTLDSDNLTKALELGFELQLNEDCSMCIESKGACGYNQTSRAFVCYCQDGTHCGSRKRSRGTLVKAIPIVSGSVAGVVLFLIILSLLFYFLRKREKRLKQKKLNSLIPLKHYSYAQVKKITKSFAEVIGKGGFGIVYKGTLSDGRMVAVKVLKDIKGNGEDFINEVGSISQTSHQNIVSLLGFCSEDSKRAIIYEYLGNGSLDKFISNKTSIINMDSTIIYGIALGVARGLEYLHHGCKTRIVHFDIKPQNVLLDDNLCPKVSDFGLAKLCEKKESVLSLMDTRGTVGYIAPEMISRVYGSVSHKSDVYSYGMLVLEMIGARKQDKSHLDSSSNESSIYFPEWIYRDLELGKSRKLTEHGINNEEDETVKKMTLVGLWCIQAFPLDRPPMNRVIEMMEGSLDAIEFPPRPVLQIPTTSLQESTTTLSEDTSVFT